jgi:hypothetical protein
MCVASKGSANISWGEEGTCKADENEMKAKKTWSSSFSIIVEGWKVVYNYKE